MDDVYGDGGVDWCVVGVGEIGVVVMGVVGVVVLFEMVAIRAVDFIVRVRDGGVDAIVVELGDEEDK